MYGHLTRIYLTILGGNGVPYDITYKIKNRFSICKQIIAEMVGVFPRWDGGMGSNPSMLYDF
jgi:hypothetical protein